MKSKKELQMFNLRRVLNIYISILECAKQSHHGHYNKQISE